MRVLACCLVLFASAVPAFAQPFANAKTSLSNYSVADTMPGKPCESLSAYKGEGIVSINARVVRGNGGYAAALPGDRHHHAGGRVRDQSCPTAGTAAST